MHSWNIVLKNFSAGYGSHVVLSNINASFPAGKISVILGGSGCGKSTLLRHIIGLQRPLAGEVLIGGQNLFALSRHAFRRLRRRMGVLFQDGALLGALNLAENVALPLSQHLSLAKPLLKEAANRVLRMVGLEAFASFYPNELSGGMRKRAGLARAIIADPLVLLCDEPTSGLDPVTAARMDDLLLSFHGQYPEMTMLVVSHDLASLKKIADYALVLRDGQAVFAGTLQELENSGDEYIEQFLTRNPGPEELDFKQPQSPQVSAALEKWLNS